MLLVYIQTTKESYTVEKWYDPIVGCSQFVQGSLADQVVCKLKLPVEDEALGLDALRAKYPAVPGRMDVW